MFGELTASVSTLGNPIEARRKAAMTPMRIMTLAAIHHERDRQEQLMKEGRFAYTCASPEMTTAQRLAVLGEELGEVGHEVNEGFGPGRTMGVEALRKEIVQTAAVAVAWIEALGVPREAVMKRVDESTEAGLTNPNDPEPSVEVRFAHLSHYYGRVSTHVALELASLSDKKEDMIPVLFTFTGACVQWLEAL